MFEIHKLSLSFGDKELFHIDQLKLQVGKSYALIGPNGSGKSSLIKSILGLVRETQVDKILWNKQPISLYDPGECTWMPSQVNFEIEWSVKDFVLSGLNRFKKWYEPYSREDYIQVEKYLKDFELEHLSLRRINSLSDGEKQRSLLAKTFISRPHFVLLDEPTSFVDLPHKIRLNRFFKDWANQSNRLVLYSTHDIQFCLNEVDEVLFLFEGHIHQMLPDDFKRSKILKDWIGNFEL